MTIHDSDDGSQDQSNYLNDIRLGNGSTLNFSPVQNRTTVVNFSSIKDRPASLDGLIEMIVAQDVKYMKRIRFFDRELIWKQIKLVEQTEKNPLSVDFQALKLAVRYCVFRSTSMSDPESTQNLAPQHYHQAARRLLENKSINLEPLILSKMIRDKEMADIYWSAEQRNV